MSWVRIDQYSDIPPIEEDGESQTLTRCEKENQQNGGRKPTEESGQGAQSSPSTPCWTNGSDHRALASAAPGNSKIGVQRCYAFS